MTTMTTTTTTTHCYLGIRFKTILISSNSSPAAVIRETTSSCQRPTKRQFGRRKISSLYIFILTSLAILVTVQWFDVKNKSSYVVKATNEVDEDDKDDIDTDSEGEDADLEETEEAEDDSLSTTSPIIVNRVDKLRQTLDVNFSTNHTDLGSLTVESASGTVVDVITHSLKQRLETLFKKATTTECRTKIGQHMSYFVNAIGKEESLPFADVTFPNECGEPVYDFRNMPEGMHIGDIQNRTYQPPRNESSEYIDDPDNLILLYGILTHNDPIATIRLINSLDEDGLNHKHQFVIHVDGKEMYDDTQTSLLEFSATKSNVHIVPNGKRVRVNWGGFSMVNATLQILKYAFDLDSDTDGENAIKFHKFVHLSSSTYPIASNPEIRHRLASYPLDANFAYIIMQPTRANPYVWHYFVECDDALHRIYQLPVLRDPVHGANTFTSSQWFIASYEFAQYLAEIPDGSFVDQFIRYAEHVVVADETFFGTVLRHTKFCHKHHNNNFLHLQFDRWESDLPASKRDERKCPMPNPDHCGRSPTLMTVDYADIMELSDNLFARKFDSSVDLEVKGIVDEWRASRLAAIKNGTEPLHANRMTNFEFQGQGVLFVAKSTVNDPVPLCLGLADIGNKIKLVPCFENWVPQTLAEKWETGAVVLSETIPHTRWEVGPCTSDGKLARLSTGEINVTLGRYSTTGPRCMLKQMDGIRVGRCFDGGSTNLQPGGETQVYPCVREWYQFVSFGYGRNSPKGSLYSTIPSHIVKQIKNLGHDQIPYMCLGVSGRGISDEIDWKDEEHNESKDTSKAENHNLTEVTSLLPLSNWNNQSIVTTQCSNIGGVIEWVVVPFIIEDEPVASENSTTDNDLSIQPGEEL